MTQQPVEPDAVDVTLQNPYPADEPVTQDNFVRGEN